MVAAVKPRLRETRNSLSLMRRSPLAMVGLVIVAAIVLIAIFAPVLAPTPAG